MGRAHCVLSTCPRLLGSVGTISYKFCRKGSSPCWGLWAPGQESLPGAVSLFPVKSWCQWSFWDLSNPQVKVSDLPPEALRGPAQRPCSAPQLRASCSQHHLESSLKTEEDTPSLRLRVYTCVLSGLFLLTCHNGRWLLLSSHCKTQYILRNRLSYWSLGFWMQCIWCSRILKANKKIHFRDFPLCLFISSRVLPLEFPTPCAHQHTLSNVTK